MAFSLDINLIKDWYVVFSDENFKNPLYKQLSIPNLSNYQFNPTRTLTRKRR